MSPHRPRPPCGHGSCLSLRFALSRALSVSLQVPVELIDALSNCTEHPNQPEASGSFVAALVQSNSPSPPPPTPRFVPSRLVSIATIAPSPVTSSVLSPAPTRTSATAKKRPGSPLPPPESARPPPSPAMSSDGEMEDAVFDDDDDVEILDAYSEDSEIQDEDTFDDFIPVNVESQTKKPYDVTWKVRTVEELYQLQRKEVAKIVGLLEVDDSTAAILLRHYAWNAEKLQELFWEDPAKALKDAGLSPTSSPVVASTSLPPLASPKKSKRTIRATAGPSSKPQPFECPICCMDYDDESDSLSLGCQHRFCKGCWKEYLERKVKTEAESGRVQCMEAGCQRVVKEQVFQSLLDDSTASRYHDLLNATFVNDSPSLRWCPHPSCVYAIECHQAPPRLLNQIVPTVICKCGGVSCFGCGYAADHRPVLCKVVKLWEKKCADDSETANWLNANTKECTKCASTIEKNGGCNHMTCKKCKHEFCWVCMGPWSEHGTAYYNCNRFDQKSGTDARDAQAKSRQSLERYLHYFNRWANHEQSAKLDQDLYAKTEKKMEQMQHSSKFTWIEVQFAKQAVDVLVAARMTLKWTYCMAFYLKRCNQTELFEDNQRDLERAVEQLSGLLESPIEPSSIPELRTNVTNMSAYVSNRNDIMRDDTLNGYLEKRWEFVIEI